MVFRIRILPLTMFAAFMLLAVKLADLVRGGEEFSHAFLIGSVEAQAPKPQDAPPAPPAAASSSSTSSSGSSSGAAAGTSSSSGSAEPAKPAEGEKSGEKSGEKASPSPTSSTPPEEPPPGSGHGLAPGARIFSPTELELLQSLSKRRDQLDGWQKDLEIKENLLSATEQRIDSKIAAVDVMKKELQDMIAIYTSAEDAKIKSLVKIYEDMKPRDAARIFNELEMPVLLMVIDKMAEKKAAPILAEMDPKKAKQVTVELAEQRRLQNAKVSTAKQAAGAPAPNPAAAPAPKAP